MSIIIIGDSFTFPEGNAATNRVHTYAKGFSELGIQVHVICFGSNYTSAGNGSINGINYYHPFNQIEKNHYFLIRQWHKFLKYYRTIQLVRKINKTEKITAFNCWTQKFRTQLITFFMAKLVRAINTHERSEHPLRNYQDSSIQKMQGEIKSYIGTKLCDGILCISQYLIDFYSSRGVNPKRMLLVPSTVDTERFAAAYKPVYEFEYILYCGSITIRKDGVDILVQSFAKIAEKFPEIKLVIIGKGDTENEVMEIRNIVSKFNLDNRVLFLGQISREEVPKYMCNAKVLALARPSSIVADAGFPSKLTEYLATGKPVIVTTVGEIPVYLKDNENAFLSEPDSSDAFASKLEYILGNYETALEVSAKGQELTNTIFNYSFQAKRIASFINSIRG
jgi:glycosyltransferase involved in cell wall biosynthesis